jgi:hypothetical protein
LEQPVATFLPKKGSHKEILRIEASGTSIIDEVVVSFVYFVGKEGSKRKSRMNRVTDAFAVAVTYGFTGCFS